MQIDPSALGCTVSRAPRSYQFSPLLSLSRLPLITFIVLSRTRMQNEFDDKLMAPNFYIAQQSLYSYYSP